MGASGQRHAPAALCPRERTPGTHCTGGWVGLRAGLDTEVRGKILCPLPGIKPRSPGRPVRSQTLYWLSYPAHSLWGLNWILKYYLIARRLQMVNIIIKEWLMKVKQTIYSSKNLNVHPLTLHPCRWANHPHRVLKRFIETKVSPGTPTL
jgi:hypothetical protein